MKRFLLIYPIIFLFNFACQQNRTAYRVLESRSDITLCAPIGNLSFSYINWIDDPVKDYFTGPIHPHFLPPGIDFGIPEIVANDNRSPAGKMVNGTLELDLEVVWGAFRFETEDRPGLRLTAIGEVGKPPSVPGPLVRVETGAKIHARIHNTLLDSTITVFGFQTRPSDIPDSLFLRPGESAEVTFEAGDPGTYMYWVHLGKPIANFNRRRNPERQQLAGAFIIDPIGGSPPDRVFVMNIFDTRVDTAVYDYGTNRLEALTINGRSWPFTERLRPSVGDTVRWRVINASMRNHPMHLHGFFYHVLSAGTPLADTRYTPEQRREVVTEFMGRQSTISMEWIVRRPGNWLFHCHLSFHVWPELRLPGAAQLDDEHQVHMAGLVLGIEVPPGPSDLISKGAPKKLTLYANEYDLESGLTYGFSFDPEFRPDSRNSTSPGPPLVLKQYQPVFITVKNRMSTPTSVHWHGLEIDSWSDGVPEYSASDGRKSPIIFPGEEFTYKLTLMRPGSYLYHSHYHDVDQLTNGLYGALIVLGEDETFDSKKDHHYIVGWRTPDPRQGEGIEVNGDTVLAVQHATVGETHRIRVMNMAPAGRISAKMLKEDQPVWLTYLAKDGATLPEVQQVALETSPRYGVGETADFAFSPTEPGRYELNVGYRNNPWKQVWEVAEK
jgi:FtsP/CotA-like multicopper oxidase with cupredoxin domain